jgi:acetyl-CoA carboxylase biotin carboxyl carrier protein
VSEKKRKPRASASSTASNAGGGGRGGAAGPMNVDFLQQLVNLMAANDLNTVDLRDSGQRIILKRGATQVFTTAAAAAPVAYAAPAAQPTATSAGAPAAPKAPADEEAGLIPIKSPMVGTFYAKPSPDAPKPFVTVGSVVIKDETDVCIIEAMKTFNTLKADVSGTIARVLVQNGETVDVNKPLFLVKPS